MIFSSILPHSLIEESLSSSQHDKFLLQQYLAQPPHDDAGLYPRILEYSLDDKGRASIIFHSILVQKKIAQFEKLLIQEAKASLNCLQLPTSCSFIASLCDPQATSKAAKSSARPVQSPNDSDSRTPNGRLILGESSLCEQLQRFSLDDDPANTDQPESRQTFPLTPPIAISDDPQTAKGNFIEISTLNYSHSDQNYLESQLLPRHLPINAARSFNSHPRMERQEQEQEQEQHSTISDYSSSSSSPHSEEIFSLENSSSNDTNSVSIFIRGDDEEAALYNGMAEQVSRSDLVNEFARFTISWFIAWTANRRNNMGSDSHNQEVRTYERQNSGRCTCGNGRKRPRENGHSGRTKKQQKRDDSNEEDDHDDSKRNISSITKSLPNKCLKPLACPFFQRDQLSFGHGRWKLCAHGSWNEYHRVRLVHICHEKYREEILTSEFFREHVYRKHILPTNHCDRCFKDLKDAQTLLQHRNQSQCEQTALLYTTADRILQLKLPMKRGIEESQKWEIMYRILFPDDIHVPSPCVCYYISLPIYWR